jgi:hypothetical protein
MRQSGYRRISGVAALVVASMFAVGGQAHAQNSQGSTMPDAQIEANVLKGLAGAPQLANENITTNTVYGTVTLSGSVKDEPTRQLAETLASRATGVKKVVDELTLSSTAGGDPAGGTNPTLQSDGSTAPTPAPGAHAPDPDTYAAQHAGDATNGQNNLQDDPANVNQPAYRAPYGAPDQGVPNAGAPTAGSGQPPYPPNQPPYSQNQQQPYPPAQPPYRGQQGAYLGDPRNQPAPYGAQVAGQPVTVPAGSLLRIRINEGLDSKHTQPGTPFDAVVLNDVVADGAVAIPRGASVQGIVVDSKSGGVLKGHGEIQLKLTQVNLAGRSFPITTDVWTQDSSDKSGQTIGSAVGLGAFGALVGAVAGGGPGAAIGAAAGGAAGIGSSAASGSRQVLIPSEAILTFHTAQPAPMTTISQAEMDRLSYGVPTGAQQPIRRRPQPYYGPVYYPRPYPY